MKIRYYAIFAILVLLLVGCAVHVEKPLPALTAVSPREYPLLKDDLDTASLQQAIGRSLEYYRRLPDNRRYHFGDESYTVRELRESLMAFRDLMENADSAESFERQLYETFDIYRASGKDGRGTVLFTGYYAPVLDGSREKTPQYGYPIYRTPGDHIIIDLTLFDSKYDRERIVARVVNGRALPYYTRKNIDVDGHLAGKGLEIAWLADPVDIFFLHIQGSGIVRLPDGTLLRVSYDQSNGHPYRSIGRFLVDQGKLSMDEVSLTSIRRYLRSHSDEMFRVLAHNESYVFFRIVEDGPVGCLDVPVTSGRTIATDSELFPKGAIAFIKTKKPIVDSDGNITTWEPFSRFVLNQDTGGAISGPGRVDLYCGLDRYAEIMAGHLKEEGELYFLVKKRK